MRKGCPPIPPPLRSQSNQSGSDSDESLNSGGRRKKKDGFSSKIQIPEFRGKMGHPHDVAKAFRQWAHCITYYCDYYEDSYFMPLVVSSLTGDASDVFNWTCSVSPGDAQDLSELLQMLREHYCSSFTFWEQRNMVDARSLFLFMSGSCLFLLMLCINIYCATLGNVARVYPWIIQVLCFYQHKYI